MFQDLRHALRLLAKNPLFALVGIVTLALGIGATTAVFTLVNALLIKPLPYEDPARLASREPAELVETIISGVRLRRTPHRMID